MEFTNKGLNQKNIIWLKIKTVTKYSFFFFSLLFINTSIAFAVVPVIDTVTPNIGSSNGYNTITVAGSEFSEGDIVSINNVDAETTIYNNSNSLTVIVPPSGTSGSYDLKVRHVDGEYGTLSNGYTYSYPVVTGVAPGSGTPAGGTSVTITGDYFTANYFEQLVTVDTSNGALPADYQMKVVMDTATPISNNDMQADCDDLRFYKSDEHTPIPFWIESGCNTSNTIIWLKFPDPIAMGSTVYISARYGFPTMEAKSNGNNVFPFFDDFSSASYDTSKWTDSIGTVTQAGGIMSLSSASGIFAGNYVLPYDSIIETSADPISTGRIGAAVRAATNTLYGFVGDGGANVLDILWWPGALYSESDSGESFMGAFATGFHKYTIAYRPNDTDTANFDYNNSELTNNRTGTNPADTLHPVLYSSNGQSDYDFILVRKYVANEPSISVGGQSIKSVFAMFDYIPGTSTAYVSQNTITTVTPAHTTGYVDVLVLNANNHSGTLYNGYAYSGEFSNNDSTFVGDPTSVSSDGYSSSILTATIRDSSASPLPAKVIRIGTISGPVIPTIVAIDCTYQYTTDSEEPIEATTNNNGQACFRATATTTGTVTIPVINVTDGNTELTDSETLVFYESPTDPDLSQFQAYPETTEPGTPAEIYINLRNTANVSQPGKTVTIHHDGTGITLTPVVCFGSSGEAGISDSAGDICYTADSATNQTVNFTVTVNEGNVDLTQARTVNYYIAPPSTTYSSITTLNGGTSHEFEPIDPDNYDYDNYSEYNASFVAVTAKDDSNQALSGRTVQLSLTPTANYFIRSTSCSDPRSSGTSTTSTTDSSGQACFLVYNSGDLVNNDPPTSVVGQISNGPGIFVDLPRDITLTAKSQANTYTYSYRFRNDDGDELTATSIEASNTPNYNASIGQPFRLRMNITRADGKSDEFSQFQSTNLGPVSTGEGGGGEGGPRGGGGGPIPIGVTNASPAPAVDLDSKTIYEPFSMGISSSLRIYKYNYTNIATAPTYFDITPPLDSQIPGLIYTATKSFVDSSNQLLYVVVTPLNDYGDTYPVRVLKIDLDSETLVDIIGESYLDSPFSYEYAANSFDSEIDLDHGFIYLTLGGDISSRSDDQTYTRIVKIKLNGPTDDMTKVGTLLLDRTTSIISSSIIDATNQFMYVTYNDPQKIVKIDLDVEPTQPPVKVDEILLVPNNDQSPHEKVGLQGAVIDTVNGYAYFAGSTDYTQITDLTSLKAYLTKVDISPTRSFEVISRLKLSESDLAAANSPSGLEYLYYDPDTSGLNTMPSGAIDIPNQYAYFAAGHYNITSGYSNNKLIRVDLNSFTHDSSYDEINTGSRNISGNMLIPELGQGFFIGKTTLIAQPTKLFEYHTNNSWNFKLQSSPNVDGQYCNSASLNSYEFEDVNAGDLQFTSSTNFGDGDNSSNVSGLLPDNTSQFVAGALKSEGTSTDTIHLGRNNFTEIEFNLLPTATAHGSYCLQLVDEDISASHQVGAKIDHHFARTLSNPDPNSFDIFPVVSVGGIILSKTSVNLIEGTSTDTYGIKLATQPSSSVTVHIGTADNRLTLSPDSTPASPTEASFIFTDTNWDTFQYVTVSAANNGTIDGTTTSNVTHTVTSADNSYNNIISRPVNTTVTDYGSTSANVIANVAGDITFTPPSDFTFPVVNVDYSDPNYSPSLSLNINESRGTSSDFTVTLQTSPFCKTPTVCIPIANIYLTSSDLVNSFNTYNAAQIGEFVSNYLQPGSSLTDRTTYVHSNPADDKTLNNVITIIDSRAVPSGSSENPLQGSIDLLLHLMIDYGSILTQLEVGTYTTTLTFDLNPNP